MASDLQNLPDLECFIKLPGQFLVRTKLTYKSYQNKHLPFSLRDGLEIEKGDKISGQMTGAALLSEQAEETIEKTLGEEIGEKPIVAEWWSR
jgi:hypothetical protein